MDTNSEKYTLIKKILRGLRIINPYPRCKTKQDNNAIDKTEIDFEKRTSIKKCLDGPKPIRSNVFPATHRNDNTDIDSKIDTDDKTDTKTKPKKYPSIKKRLDGLDVIRPGTVPAKRDDD